MYGTQNIFSRTAGKTWPYTPTSNVTEQRLLLLSACTEIVPYASRYFDHEWVGLDERPRVATVYVVSVAMHYVRTTKQTLFPIIFSFHALQFIYCEIAHKMQMLADVYHGNWLTEKPNQLVFRGVVFKTRFTAG